MILNIRKLEKALTNVKLNAQRCLMINLSLNIVDHQAVIDLVQVKVLKQNKRLSVLESRGYQQGILKMSLKMTLLHDSVNEAIQAFYEENEIIGFVICKEEVYSFSNLLGDDNPIHLTERPIVQGFLLLEKIYEELEQINYLELKFISPVYAGEKIRIKKEPTTVGGYCHSQLCFKAIYH